MFLGTQIIGGLGVQPFNFTEHDDNIAQEWRIWLRSFELFIQVYECRTGSHKNMIERDKCALLLHHAGPKVQMVYDSLEDLADEVPRGPLINSMNPHLTEYDMMIAKLNNFFAPKRGPHYEQYVFSLLTQKQDEKIEFFAVRLKQQAERCSYGDQLQQNMKNQLIKGCWSTNLREKLLEHGSDTFDKLMARAKTHEVVNEQKKIFDQKVTIESQNPLAETVHKIGNYHSGKSLFQNNIICNRCGYKGHRAADDKCPAKSKLCNKCGLVGHFAKKCHTKKTQGSLKRNQPDNGDQPEEKKIKPDKEEIKFVTQNNDTDEDIFCIETSSGDNKIICNIGCVDIPAIIDSGSKFNLVDEESWKWLKLQRINILHKEKGTDQQFTAYGGHKLIVLGMFSAKLTIGNQTNNAKFYVMQGTGKVLIGRNTAEQFGILKMGTDINQVSNINKEFSKIKGVMVNIPIRKDVKPVNQPYRRIPVAVEKLVNEKIDDMLQQGIIERINKPSSWVSPMVIIPKQNSNEIRICIDMRRANQAVDRENHPLPTFEDFLPELGNAKWFSKIDIKNAFHQV